MSRLALVLRRALLDPLACVLIVLVLALSPFLMLAVLLVGAVTDRRLRLARALALGISYLLRNLVTVVVAFGFWVRSPRRARQDPDRRAVEYARSLLDVMYRSAQALLRIDIAVDGDADAVAAVADGTAPLIVLSRHAGPGDAFLLAQALMQRGRAPRAVVRAALGLDPTIGILGRRMGFSFVRRSHGRSGRSRDRIRAMAASLQPQDALLLFPEGGNVSDERRRRNLRTLLRRGRSAQARRAGRLRNLAAPISGGVLAALEGARGTDVVFVAHSGLAGMSGPVWEWVPMDVTLRMRWCLVPASAVPEGEAARERWLLDWWQRLDTWVTEAVEPEPIGAFGEI